MHPANTGPVSSINLNLLLKQNNDRNPFRNLSHNARRSFTLRSEKLGERSEKHESRSNFGHTLRTTHLRALVSITLAISVNAFPSLEGRGGCEGISKCFDTTGNSREDEGSGGPETGSVGNNGGSDPASQQSATSNPICEIRSEIVYELKPTYIGPHQYPLQMIILVDSSLLAAFTSTRACDTDSGDTEKLRISFSLRSMDNISNIRLIPTDLLLPLRTSNPKEVFKPP
ncbi:hypothetical protein WG66_008845 [Moniliophthora roreri]|nr:hypothetical protein WG66_008845 [Moniliophthora roreri]